MINRHYEKILGQKFALIDILYDIDTLRRVTHDTVTIPYS